MRPFHNPRRTDKAHPATSPGYGLDTEKVLKHFDINVFTGQRWFRRMINRASIRCKSNLVYVDKLVREIYLSCPKYLSTTVTQKRLAERSGMAVRTVRKIIAGLRQTGVIHVDHNYRDTKLGRRRTASTMYIIPMVNWIIKQATIGINNSYHLQAKSLQAQDASQLFTRNTNTPQDEIINRATGEILQKIPPMNKNFTNPRMDITPQTA